MGSLARFGKYELTRRIGVGGMAEVYEASLLGPGGFSKRLALKLLLPRLQKDSELVAMFMDEASIAAGLDHPNVVSVFEFGQIEGSYFMAMEYVEGWELAEVEQCCSEARRSVPLALAAHVVRELCRGLAHIHGDARGIVHRDVTPHNVFISRRGQVKLGDFGIAKAAARHTHTEAGRIKGKLAYLAPEQATGEQVTARTDIYAAGLILYELLAGQRLIHAATEIEHIQLAMNPPRVLPSSSRPEAAPLDGIVGRALERHPALRYPSAALMAAELDRYLEANPAGAEQLAAFVAEVTGGARQVPSSMELSPLPPGAVPTGEPGAGRTVLGTGATPAPLVRSRRSPSSQTPRVSQPGAQQAERLPYDRTSPSALEPSRNRLGLWVGAGLLAASALGLGTAVIWPRIAGGPRGGTGSIDAAGALARSPDLRAAPPDARSLEARAPDRATRPDRERPRPSSKRPRIVVPPRPQPRRPDAGPQAARPSPTEVARAERQRLQAALLFELQQAQTRGLWPGDDPELDRALAQSRRALQSGTVPEAESALAGLRARVKGFQIDRGFAERKLGRLNRAIAAASGRLGEADKQRLATLSQNILRLIMEGRLVEASGQMSRALGGLTRRP